eukprot:CAMPEP_0180825740 /NCGR_PEP_ID=MMETSP1038_2-20121128/73144_1 /TAXON_ID=632150 /ORGANISM="Azadinium spinosum, Strain 3D9" /LENGTH=99 /DNA_ID=CAMNT_0022868247 /DNA_START=154 /DNA_END=450 /DNA_ORIENTATION=+
MTDCLIANRDLQWRFRPTLPGSRHRRPVTEQLWCGPQAPPQMGHLPPPRAAVKADPARPKPADEACPTARAPIMLPKMRLPPAGATGAGAFGGALGRGC